MMMRTFKGYPSNRGDAMVTVTRSDGSEVQLNPRNDLINHSPDGFQWGYAGSGPAQLALAICSYVLGDEEGLKVYQAFKLAVIAKLPRGAGWEITEYDVREEVAKLREVGYGG